MLFEMETVLSVRERAPKAAAARIRSSADLRALEARAFDTQPPRKAPEELSKPVTAPAKWLEASVGGGSGGATGTGAAPADSGGVVPSLLAGSASVTQRQSQRIMRQLASYLRDPHPSIEVYPASQNIAFWQFLLTGPPATPYAGGVWLGYVLFPRNYPVTPPEVRFVTPIYHCNINSSGKASAAPGGPCACAHAWSLLPPQAPLPLPS